jgi:hypothetical protein
MKMASPPVVRLAVRSHPRVQELRAHRGGGGQARVLWEVPARVVEVSASSF